MAIASIMSDFLVRYQQTAIRETGCRPVTFLRTPMDEALVLPGCQRPGFTFWQPVAWPGEVPLGPDAESFHASIRDYLSVCQFLEIRFQLPVLPGGSPLSFLHGRVFETCKNTVSFPPSRAFEEARMYSRYDLSSPLACCMAVTADEEEPLLLMLRAEDGQVFVRRAAGDSHPIYFNLGVERLLPKLQFVYRT